jgi:hypothetical protein
MRELIFRYGKSYIIKLIFILIFIAAVITTMVCELINLGR